MNTKAQGDIGVAMAIAYFTLQGCPVSIPMGDNTRYDLIVEIRGQLKKVQCKCSRYKVDDRYVIALRTNGGNKTGTSTKKISAEDADILFVYTFDGGWYEFPQSEFVDKASITIGSKKEIYRVN